MDQLATSLGDVARGTAFSGAVRIDDRSGLRVAAACGPADRRCGVPNTIDTRFAIGSG